MSKKIDRTIEEKLLGLGVKFISIDKYQYKRVSCVPYKKDFYYLNKILGMSTFENKISSEYLYFDIDFLMLDLENFIKENIIKENIIKENIIVFRPSCLEGTSDVGRLLYNLGLSENRGRVCFNGCFIYSNNSSIGNLAMENTVSLLENNIFIEYCKNLEENNFLKQINKYKLPIPSYGFNDEWVYSILVSKNLVSPRYISDFNCENRNLKVYHYTNFKNLKSFVKDNLEGLDNSVPKKKLIELSRLMLSLEIF